MIKLYDYQENAINKLNDYFQDNNKVLLQLPTGAGKTFVFSFFVKEWVKNNPNAKVLILVHREELLNQSASSLRKIDVSVETLTASKKKLHHQSNSYVAMVETAVNRLKNDKDYFNNITLVIADECHLLLFDRVFKNFEKCKILGVTATPYSYKKIYFSKCAVCGKEFETVTECCNYETYEYTRRFNFCEIYDKIISTVQISDLIKLNSLVPEINYSVGGVDRSKLTIDAKTGDYDNKSSDEQFSSSGALLDVILNYESICKGKKTLIFNNSTKINLLVYNQFLEKGYTNVKMLDSVNKCESRKSTLEWFKNTPNGVLLNCGILTAGFDQDDIEAIIMNRATTSLMLYIQIAGRGARTTTKIFKDKFFYIDLGGNIECHGRFSDNIDWVSKFYGNDEKPKPKKEALDQTKQCPECGLIHAKNELQCPECDYLYIEKEKKIAIGGEVAQLIDEIPKPNGKKIVDYCQRVGRDRNFAWTILINQILDLFIFHSVTFGSYLQAEKNGKFDVSMRGLIKEPYQTIQNSTLESGTMRTKAYIINKIKKKLNEYYSRK